MARRPRPLLSILTAGAAIAGAAAGMQPGSAAHAKKPKVPPKPDKVVGLQATYPMDGVAYPLPTNGPRP